MTMRWMLSILALAALLTGCDDGGDDLGTLPANVLDFSSHQLPPFVIMRAISDGEADPQARLSGSIAGEPVTIVKLSGKTNHFGRTLDLEYIDYAATVPDTPVWIAEHPWTRELGVRTDATGWWTMYIVKDAGVDLGFSFVYDREGWITTKSNVIPVSDQDDTDLAIQYIDPEFYNRIMRPYVVGQVQANGYPQFVFENAMVVTVGKSWGSMHDDRLPHGDPGATVSVSPAAPDAVGPVYFNEAVIPDFGWSSTSVDGGVTWLNMPRDATYNVTAMKAGVTYPTVQFRITSQDLADGVQLYIASPPDSLEGSNDSPP
ncbi:MAG: hypothetical protein R3228_12155, partial [Halioglobus sp.]|nr:hypothetical protein [Halioglobus sp.]